jgi:hypothetical protein
MPVAVLPDMQYTLPADRDRMNATKAEIIQSSDATYFRCCCDGRRALRAVGLLFMWPCYNGRKPCGKAASYLKRLLRRRSGGLMRRIGCVSAGCAPACDMLAVRTCVDLWRSSHRCADKNLLPIALQFIDTYSGAFRTGERACMWK